jgi:hypothetical protein
VLIQEAAAALGDVKLGTIQSAWRRLNNHPALFVRDGARRDELAAAATGTHTKRGPEAGWQVAGWVRKALVQADGYKVAHADLLHSFHGWQHLEMGDDVVRPLDIRAFVPALHLACPWITPVKVLGNRYAGGVELNAEGLSYWEQHRGSGSRGLAFSSEHVNTVWKGRTHERAFKAAAAPAQLGLPIGGGDGAELSAARPQGPAKF